MLAIGSNLNTSTKFSLVDAKVIRRSLGELDFEHPVSNDTVTQSYLGHYELHFSKPDLSVTHYLGLIPCDEFELVGQYFTLPAEQQKGTAILVHGYYDHVGIYGHLIRHCLEQGYSVLTFDLPGHGLSSGEVAGINNFDKYSQSLTDCIQLSDRHGLTKPWLIIGQSTGAAAIINYLLKPEQFRQSKLDKIILLAPLLKPDNWSRAVLAYYFMRIFVKKVKRNFGNNSHDHEFSKFILENDPLQSRFLMVNWVTSLKRYLVDFEAASSSQEEIYIIQGSKDDTVDWKNNISMLENKFPNAQSRIIEGARHHLVNESYEYRQQIFAAIDSILEG